MTDSPSFLGKINNTFSGLGFQEMNLTNKDLKTYVKLENDNVDIGGDFYLPKSDKDNKLYRYIDEFLGLNPDRGKSNPPSRNNGDGTIV